MTSSLILILQVIRYNLKVVFAGRFILFLLAAIAFYIFFMIVSVFDNVDFNLSVMYEITFLPALLLIFYPVVFGIQRDDDARMLEILFGIPDYRYKVWLVRIILIFVLVFLMLILFSALGSYLLYPINPILLSYQLMYPVSFLGSLAFLLSTRIKNGNATAVVMVILGFFLSIFSEIFDDTMWNIFMNPFGSSRELTQVAYQQIVWKNRIFLMVGSVIFILGSLLNLQNRERYI
ncbi:hypothetical protein [Portibacter marinus]|uniref:hypothetical protein n=1 Tax=Portibacter marinus TaxID=2898660 RepID=UPI001F330303|nr:hypothetical protein [Portibacter marinus]